MPGCGEWAGPMMIWMMLGGILATAIAVAALVLLVVLILRLWPGQRQEFRMSEPGPERKKPGDDHP